ncbi:2-oxo acid dehydrogenase subunit E2 [Novosphingobium malaysiense]|uniref:2-oxo acid dehydrogenase subunit E2 n=1 Tax=Novosphingobium malaysiense TaxID=1348853 RepID=UPI00068C159F|nr:2-oxo acid dehydrogenase subunit E2 [Novosphingobium malaysiense]
MSDADQFTQALADYGEVEPIKRTRIQKIVAKTMCTSVTTIPHVTHHDKVDVTGLETYRKSMGKEQKVSPLIFIVKAAVDALTDFPDFNASLSPDGEVLVRKKFFNVGIAVDSPLGLLVPVLRDCDTKDLQSLNGELKEMTELARTKGLPLAAMSGGCFTISSLGGIGGTYFTPIISPPEVAILGVTGIQTEPVWDGEQFVPRKMLPLSLSYDHRVINGADAARFVKRIGESLARWSAE